MRINALSEARTFDDWVNFHANVSRVKVDFSYPAKIIECIDGVVTTYLGEKDSIKNILHQYLPLIRVKGNVRKDNRFESINLKLEDILLPLNTKMTVINPTGEVFSMKSMVPAEIQADSHKINNLLTSIDIGSVELDTDQKPDLFRMNYIIPGADAIDLLSFSFHGKKQMDIIGMSLPQDDLDRVKITRSKLKADKLVKEAILNFGRGFKDKSEINYVSEKVSSDWYNYKKNLN